MNIHMLDLLQYLLTPSVDECIVLKETNFSRTVNHNYIRGKHLSEVEQEKQKPINPDLFGSEMVRLAFSWSVL